MDFDWTDHGTITAQAIAQGLPAVTYSGHIEPDEAMQFVPELFVVFFVLSYVGMTAWDVYHAIKHPPLKLKMRVGGRVVMLDVEDLSNSLADVDQSATQVRAGQRRIRNREMSL